MRFDHYCMNCRRVKFGGVLNVYNGKLVCSECLEKLLKKEKEDIAKKKEVSNGIQILGNKK